MAKVITAPDKETVALSYSIFLAGSIEMGKAEHWQDRVIGLFEGWPVTIYNPRRKDWDSTWVQSIENEQFYNQVAWEQQKLRHAKAVIVYFDPETKSPITLMELGQVIGRRTSYSSAAAAQTIGYPQYQHIYVCCPDGYWRKGNVDFMCTDNNIPMFDNLYSLVVQVKKDAIR